MVSAHSPREMPSTRSRILIGLALVLYCLIYQVNQSQPLLLQPALQFLPGRRRSLRPFRAAQPGPGLPGHRRGFDQPRPYDRRPRNVWPDGSKQPRGPRIFHDDTALAMATRDLQPCPPTTRRRRREVGHFRPDLSHRDRG